MLRTELICIDLWPDRILRVEMPQMFEEDILNLDLTVQDISRIKGPFRIFWIEHFLDRRGYTQRLHLKVHED